MNLKNLPPAKFSIKDLIKDLLFRMEREKTENKYRNRKIKKRPKASIYRRFEIFDL